MALSPEELSEANKNCFVKRKECYPEPPNNLLSQKRDICKENKNELNSISDVKKHWDKFVDSSVNEQVDHVLKFSFTNKGWKDSERPHIQSWVSDKSSDNLKDMGISRKSVDALEEIFRYQ